MHVCRDVDGEVCAEAQRGTRDLLLEGQIWIGDLRSGDMAKSKQCAVVAKGIDEGIVMSLCRVLVRAK